MPEGTVIPDTLVLRSTQKGYMGTYIFGVVWIVFFATFSIWGWYYLSVIYAKWGVDSIWGLDNLPQYNRPHDIAALFIAIAFAGKWIGGILALLLILSTASFAIYDVRRITILCNKLTAETQAPTVTVSTWHFLWKENQQTEVFDGFVTLFVEQGFWDKILDTGTITLCTIAYMHTKERKQMWIIPAIANPHKAKAWILENIPRYGYGTQIRLN